MENCKDNKGLMVELLSSNYDSCDTQDFYDAKQIIVVNSMPYLDLDGNNPLPDVLNAFYKKLMLQSEMISKLVERIEILENE